MNKFKPHKCPHTQENARRRRKIKKGKIKVDYSKSYLVEGPLVSIIIPVVRNDPNVVECLSHIKWSQKFYKNLEILVVDEGLERSAQRNIGIARATGEYLLILDSDMMITPKLIAECVHLMRRDPSRVALYIPERIVTKGWFGRLRDWERQFYNGSLVDVVRFVRAEGCPLFDEDLHGVEDSDWERRMPGNKATTDNHFNHHDKCSLWKYLKKKLYYAQCLSAYKKKNPDDKLLTFRYRCFKVFIENGKWKRLLKRPDLSFQVAFLLLARGIIYHIQIRRYK